jgi:hypothetical protein
MPRHKWTTEEQEDWLKDRCDAFKEAEKNDTRKSFYKETYAAWLFKWPNPEPSAVQDVIKLKIYLFLKYFLCLFDASTRLTKVTMGSL